MGSLRKLQVSVLLVICSIGVLQPYGYSADASVITAGLGRRSTIDDYHALFDKKLLEAKASNASTETQRVKLEERATSLGPYASKWGFSGNSYPIVMIHGLMGWGSSPLLGILNYWGGLTTNILDTLRDNGYTIYQPAIAPASSNWERACELYAKLKGTKVDYGVARSKKFGHNRYGRDFTGEGLYPDWGTSSTKKAHLIGHSMGGPTMRTLIALLEQGSSEEVAASIAAGTTASPLFWTNKTSENFVSGAVSISGVLQGTQAVQIIEDFAGFIIDLAELLVGVSNVIPGLWDFQLSHWGLDRNTDESFGTYVKRIFTSSWAKGKSNAQYDLSMDGARSSLNTWVKNSDKVYYFSVPTRSTFTLLGYDFANLDTLLLLIPFADAIGLYTNTTLYGKDSQSWRPNDGLVPVHSSTTDDASKVVSWSFNLKSSSPTVPSAPTKGTFHNTGTITKDHLAIIGLLDLAAASNLNQIFLNLANILYSLPA